MSVCGPARLAPKLYPVDYQSRYLTCCWGASLDGARGCYCWQPEYDVAQAEPRTALEPMTNARMCGDCAYRPGSPERASGDIEQITGTFWCHRGMRRPARWRHPDGRVRPADDADYQPLIVDGVPYRADGRPAARCAGWAEAQRAESVYTPETASL